MHWWYLPVIMFVLAILASIIKPLGNKYISGRIVKGLIVSALLIFTIASCTGGLFARVWP